MTGCGEGLKPLVESCLSNDPSERPTMPIVSKQLKVSVQHVNVLLPYGEKLWQWENLANSLQKVIGGIKFGEFAM